MHSFAGPSRFNQTRTPTHRCAARPPRRLQPAKRISFSMRQDGRVQSTRRAPPRPRTWTTRSAGWRGQHSYSATAAGRHHGQARETDWRTAEARPSLHGDPTDARPRLAAGGTRDLFPGPGGSSSKPRPPRRLQKQKILTPERKNISNHAAVSVRFGRVKEGTHGIRTRLVGEGEKDP
jgi:hypothetical protein